MLFTRTIMSGVSFAALSLSTAAAQDAPSAAPLDGLQDIVVTAERREQSLQDVPISATVLTGEDLSRRGVTNLNDIQQVAPSVAINTVNRSTFINIRGVGIAQSAPTSNPGIAYYIDGQLIPHEQFIGQSFYDIGSIEVLRGPQGTLSGQNSTGGAIYVRTPEPRFDSYSVMGDLTVGNYDQFRFVTALNAGLSENVAVRMSYVHDQRDSFSNNIGPSGTQPGKSNLDAGRINLALRSSDERLRINLRGEYFDLKSDNIPVKSRTDPNPDPFTINEDGRSFLDQRGYRLSGEARYEFVEGIEVRGLVSWQDGYTRDQTDGDRSATAPAVPANLPTNGPNSALFPGRVALGDTVFETLIGEINLLSTGNGPLQWVVGGFILDESVPVALLRDNRNTTDFVQSNSTIDTVADNNSKSVFGQVNWFVTEQIELLAGGRYSWDRQDYTRNILPGPPRPAFTSTLKSEELTGKLGVNLHLDDTLVYLTASKGYKAGGVNLELAQGTFGPETNFVYEAGVKTELFDRHIRVNGAVFYSDYKDIQLASLQAGLPVTQNAASGKSWGAELEVTAQFGGFGANLGAGYLDAEFGEGVCLNNTNSTAPDASCTVGNQFVPKGRTLPFSPEWTINAGAQYAISVGMMTLTPRVQWAHLASQDATPFPSALTLVPSRDVFDARLTLDIDDKWKLEGFVNNFTDEIYIASQIQNTSSATGGSIYGAPRTWGVRAVVKLGDY